MREKYPSRPLSCYEQLGGHFLFQIDDGKGIFQFFFHIYTALKCSITLKNTYNHGVIENFYYLKKEEDYV